MTGIIRSISIRLNLLLQKRLFHFQIVIQFFIFRKDIHLFAFGALIILIFMIFFADLLYECKIHHIFAQPTIKSRIFRSGDRSEMWLFLLGIIKCLLILINSLCYYPSSARWPCLSPFHPSRLVYSCQTWVLLYPLKNTSETSWKTQSPNCSGHPYRSGPQPNQHRSWSGRLGNYRDQMRFRLIEV